MIYAVLAVAILAVGVSIMALMRLSKLRQRFDAALGGEGTDSLEQTLAQYLSRVEAVDKRLSILDIEYNRLGTMASLASQKISLVRFNPFGDTGGDQSFSLAVLDAHNSGYVVTSIHGRQGTRVYVKPVDLGKSKYSLSAEEQQAITQAEQRVPPEFKQES